MTKKFDKRIFLIFLILSLFLSLVAAVAILNGQLQIPSSPIVITREYTCYNGTYFPYTVKVVYYPENDFDANMGLPSTWPVTNSQQDHNAVVPTTCTALITGVSWELPAAQLTGGVSIPLNYRQRM
ncbi:hypothetical protein [Stygiolobus azoricus]|uniref:hypothetical protein n=1 Tax=Stygiolobus azoricus TaxID=41675 RepID=UPI0018C8A590|nr:hypothetical protein [Stygiolobus azoricus]